MRRAILSAVLAIGLLAPRLAGADTLNDLAGYQFSNGNAELWAGMADQVLQVGQLQIQYNDLGLQMADLQKQIQSAASVVQSTAQAKKNQSTSSPDLQSAQKAATDARSGYQAMRAQLLASMPNRTDYDQAQTALNADKAALEQAKSNSSGSGGKVSALATKVLADQTRIAKFERVATANSPQLNAESAKLDAAQKSLTTLQGTQKSANQATNDNWQSAVRYSQSLQDQYRRISEQRDAIGAKVLSAIHQFSPDVQAQLMAEGVGLREEQEQLKAIGQPDGRSTSTAAPAIHFTSDVPQPVQQYLQHRLDSLYALHDPAVAAEYQRKQQEALDQQQQQMQQQQEQLQQQLQQMQQQSQ